MPRSKKTPAPPPPEPSREDQDAIARLNSLVLTAEEETGDVDANGLTIRQQAFVRAITGPAFMNQVKAAEMAGYGAENRQNLHGCASRNMREPHIIRAIRQTLAKKFRQDPDWLDNEAFAIAHTGMEDFVEASYGDDGKFLGLRPNFERAITSGAIGGAKEIEFDPDTGMCTKIKLYDKIAAMEFYAKLTGRMKGESPDAGPTQINLNLTLVRDAPRKALAETTVTPIGDVHVTEAEPQGLRAAEFGGTTGE